MMSTFWIFASPWCLTMYISYCSYLPGAKSTRTERTTNPRFEKGILVHNKMFRTYDAVHSCRSSEIRCSFPIERGRECLLDYFEKHVHYVQADWLFYFLSCFEMFNLIDIFHLILLVHPCHSIPLKHTSFPECLKLDNVCTIIHK